MTAKQQNHLSSFSTEKILKFTSRYENGYDIDTDDRYNAWLAVYHPKEDTQQTGTVSSSGE